MEKKLNFISSLFFILISIFIIHKSVEMEIMRGHTPGPGAFPLALGVMLIILSVVLIFRTFKIKSIDNMQSIEIKFVFITGIIVLLSFTYYFFFRNFNFFIVTIVYITVFNILLNLDSLKSIKKLSKVFVFSVTVSLMVYGFFAIVLNVPL